MTFAMNEGSHRIRCHTRGDALEDIEPSSNPGEAERLRVFERNRARFEALVSKLYDAGHEPRVIEQTPSP